MNFKLTHLPERTAKPREAGLTMVMDKGLSLRGAEDLIETGDHLIDIVKLGFGTSLVTNKLQEKIKLYQDAGIMVYFGGTLFEAFLAPLSLSISLSLICAFIPLNSQYLLGGPMSPGEICKVNKSLQGSPILRKVV